MLVSPLMDRSKDGISKSQVRVNVSASFWTEYPAAQHVAAAAKSSSAHVLMCQQSGACYAL